jgi:hypothetical protein
MRRRIARQAGVFTLALLVGCGGQSTAGGVNLGPAGQRAAAAAHARLAGPAATSAPASGKAWWRQILAAPRKAGALGGEPDLGQWWRGVTSDLARQLQQPNSGRSAPKLPHSD